MTNIKYNNICHPMNKIFYKNGFFCIVSKDLGESYEQFLNRCHFIVCQKPITVEQFNNALTMSRIWINIKYYNSIYSNDVHNIIKSMEKNL